MKKTTLLVILSASIMALLASCSSGASQAQYKKATDDLASAQSQIQSLQAQLSTAQSETQSLQIQLSTAQSETQSLQTQLSAAQSETQSLQTQLSAAQSETQSLQTQLSAAQASAVPVNYSLQSDKKRIISPSVSQADLTTLVNGNSTFAFNLFKALKDTDGNLFYSPYVISEALAMTYAGARGDTEKDMAEAMDLALSQDRLHPAFNSLDLQLKQRGQGAKESFRLLVANAIWGQKDYKFLAPFLDVLAQNYGAGLKVLDFINATEQSRVTINKWVSDQTEDRIKDLVPQIDPATTRLLLTNAIFFHADWQYKFNKDTTSNGLFYLISDIEVSVPMMQQFQSFRYAEGDSYQAVELPYDGQKLSMVILLPKAGQFNTFEELLDAGSIKAIIGNLEMQEVALRMPKFEYECSFSLKEALSTLGMGVAFGEDADFSSMNGNRDLWIHDVLHKAFVSVDESGTTAGAATAVRMGPAGAPAPRFVNVDRPFIFLIRDIPTGSIIFVGRVLNPVAK